MAPTSAHILKMSDTETQTFLEVVSERACLVGFNKRRL